jgi:F-type H+-transporting ATPase subunit alpha
LTPTLIQELDSWLGEARDHLAGFTPEPRLELVGRVERAGDGIAIVSGLHDTRLDELLLFPGDVLGVAVELFPDRIGCVLLDVPESVAAGSRVHGTGSVVRVPVGGALLGRVVDAVGRPLDGGPAIVADRLDPVETPAPAVIDRDLVSEPLVTGVAVVDAMFPIGRGQRELVIGDRATGKTALAVDAILQQRTSDVISVYVAIGQKSSSVRRVLESVRAHGAFDRCLFVVAEAEAAPGLQWLAPYTGFTAAEYFTGRGQHTLVVLDDLTKHAAIHRQLSLLLRQPAGREAYPGDVFYLHARLLERAAKLGRERGGGSLTALPVVETQGGNLSAYIPTNLISITDGQVVLDAKLFHEGHKPAVDVGRSVSRVGGKAQPPAMQGLAERLRLEYAQFLELEVFTRFGAVVDERTRRAIEHGRRVRAVLGQAREATLPLGVQVAQLLALSEGILDRIPLERVPDFKARLGSCLAQRASAALARVEGTGKLEDESRGALLAALADVAASLSTPGEGHG